MSQAVTVLNEYVFRQNNSGGFFDGPPEIIIYAVTAVEANALAETKGVYFDGVEKGVDCDCCGDRWYPAWESYSNSED